MITTSTWAGAESFDLKQFSFFAALGTRSRAVFTYCFELALFINQRKFYIIPPIQHLPPHTTSFYPQDHTRRYPLRDITRLNHASSGHLAVTRQKIPLTPSLTVQILIIPQPHPLLSSLTFLTKSNPFTNQQSPASLLFIPPCQNDPLLKNRVTIPPTLKHH